MNEFMLPQKGLCPNLNSGRVMNFSWSAEELALRVEMRRDRLVGIKVAQMTSWNVKHSDALMSSESLADTGILQSKKKKHLSLTEIKKSACAQSV